MNINKRSSYYTMIDDAGREVRSGRIPTTREGLEEFSNDIPGDIKIAIEASTSGIFAYECLDEEGIEVHLAHPTLVKPFAKKHVKTDKVDSRVLAQLLRMDYLPESYVPGEEVRDLRTIVRHRASLVRLRTSLKNRIHALLAIEGVQTSEFSDLFGKKGKESLRGVKLRPVRRKALDNFPEVLEVLEERIEAVEHIIEEKAKVMEEVKWRLNIPGHA